MKTTDEIIKEFEEIHGNKYDYSLVDYKGRKVNVDIICPKHGVFSQTPDKHLCGQGCPDCSGRKRKTNETFIKDARQIHGDKYDYSKVEYVNNKTDVDIICPIHGIFSQTPHNHLKGKGCKECGKEKNIREHPTRLNNEEFNRRSRKIHGNKYDYSKVVYITGDKEVDIICPIHGVFKQKPSVHLMGCGCKECAKERNIAIRLSNTEEFIEKSRKVHGDRYDYSLVDYTKAKNDVDIICHHKNANGIEHGVFSQPADKHLAGCGCPRCAHMESKAQTELEFFIRQQLGEDVEIISNDRKILNGKEIDIFIPSLKIGIEYHGMLWHSEYTNKNKDYHIKKYNLCKEKNINIIQILEYEYLTNKELVLDKLSHIIGTNYYKSKIYGRKCTVIEINKKVAEDFLNKNHIQGFVAASTYLGCFTQDNQLIGVMSFIDRGNNVSELTRFASHIDYLSVGVGGKLFSYYLKQYPQIKEIKSFADRRWALSETNNVYTKLGFVLEGVTKSDYRYTRTPLDYIHKFNFRKDRLMKKYPNKGLTMNMTEHEMSIKLGYYRIWDCGLWKYVFRR